MQQQMQRDVWSFTGRWYGGGKATQDIFGPIVNKLGIHDFWD